MLSKRTVRTTHALLAALAALATTRVGRADDPREDARAHYARGLALVGQNGYEGALREFNEAYAISPQFAVLYNIGQAHVALGQALEAIEVLSRYLRDGDNRVPPARRAQVQIQIAVLRSSLPNPELPPEAEAARAAGAAAGAAAGEAVAAATEAVRSPVLRPGTLAIRCPQPGLKLTLDGKRVDPASSASGIAVSAGVHHLALAAPGRGAAEQSLDLPGGAAAIVICEDLLSTPVAERPRLSLDGPPVFSQTAAAVPTQPPTVHASTIGYLLGGLGVALGSTAIGLYAWNRGQYHDAQAEQAKIAGADPASQYDLVVPYNAHVDAINRDSDITIGLAVASVGLIAGGCYLLLHDRGRDERTGKLDGTRSWAAVSPGGISWNALW
jgi:tetratricopeptide (TPR) repeat protein